MNPVLGPGKDNINDETCELLEPYLRFDEAEFRGLGL